MKTRLIYLTVCIWLWSACSKEDTPVREEFVDQNFIELLHTEHNVPLTADGKIDLNDGMTQLRLGAIVKLYIGNKEITDLTGIRNLIYLDFLYASLNLTTLDVSGMKYLNKLICPSISLTSINIRNTPMLQELDCSYNQLTNLDLSGHPKLTTLHCSNNKLTALQLKNLPKLLELTCYSNQISSLDASYMKLSEGWFILDCGKQKDEYGNDRTLHLTLTEQQREAWENITDSNINVKVIFTK